NPAVQRAIAVGTEWLGPDHPAVRCLQYGVALHHGGLPRAFLNELEELVLSGPCPVTIASPTLAPGLDLSASLPLVPSIWRMQEITPASEFANVAGRAGRPFVGLDGLVIHVVHAKPDDARRAVRNWQQLVADAKVPQIASGILELSIRIFKRVAA